MAERRINRRQTAMQTKVKKGGGGDSTILEEPEEDDEPQNHQQAKAIVTKSKDATVEVTVKVKKRRDKSRDASGKFVPLPEKEYRKGSWGDLLTNSRASLVCKESELDKKLLRVESANRGGGGDGGDVVDCKKTGRKRSDDHSPLCHKIPISDDLYLETHTHIRKSRSSSGGAATKSESSANANAAAALRHRQTALMRENDDLRDEVEQLRREAEIARVRNRTRHQPPKASTKGRVRSMEVSSKFKYEKPQTQATQTSTTCLLSPRKKSGSSQTETDGGPRSPPKKLVQQHQFQPINTFEPVQPINAFEHVQPSTQLENLRLEKENEALRREAAQLLTEMNKARSEYLECCNTMRELYHIAENLKRDNQNLLQNTEQQQSLQNKLLHALAENQEMKDILDSLVNKQKSAHGIQDDHLSQIRNVIKDVKMTIAQEMQGLALQPSASAFLAEKDNHNSNAAFRIGDSLLNDTNASEIQRILGTEPPETRRGVDIEDRSSSTQYLTLGGLSGLDSNHYRPSPLAVTKISPRISTPNSSSASLDLSEASASSFQLYRPKAAESSHGSKVNVDNEWKRLEDEVIRSFIPVRNELSTCSSYSGSTSSSPNPVNK